MGTDFLSLLSTVVGWDTWMDFDMHISNNDFIDINLIWIWLSNTTFMILCSLLEILIWLISGLVTCVQHIKVELMRMFNTVNSSIIYTSWDIDAREQTIFFLSRCTYGSMNLIKMWMLLWMKHSVSLLFPTEDRNYFTALCLCNAVQLLNTGKQMFH